MNTTSIKNIMFDLGGVLLNIDFKKTTEAFTRLGISDFDSYFTQYHAHPLFKKLETGAVAYADFYDELRASSGITSGNAAIDTAWNAMLLDFPAERITRLKELAGRYRLFLFSNTNAIHHRHFTGSFPQQFGFSFDSLFEKAWYSHLAGFRKPDVNAFRYIMEQSGLAAGETLFIDDTLPNVEAARQAGMQADLVGPGKDVLQLLDEWLERA